MKTPKFYLLGIAALFLGSSVSYGQTVLASNKEEGEKEKKSKSKKIEVKIGRDETETSNTAIAREDYAINPIPSAEQAATAAPQEEEKPAATFTLAGSVDVYAHSGFGKFNSDFNTAAPTTSFANLKGFSLGMANLIAAFQGEKTGFVADLVFGPRGSDAVFASGGYTNLAGASSAQIVNQLYTYLKVGDHVTFNLGQFNTFLGYEVISPTLNFHYSTSYLFSNGPFNHTGFRTDFTFGEGFVAKLAIMNPTDILEFNPVNTYTLGGQFGYTNDAGGIWLNAIFGDQDGKLTTKNSSVEDESVYGNLFQVDLTTGWSLGEKFYLGFNASMQSIGAGQVNTGGTIESNNRETSSFFGAAIYPKVTVSDAFALGLRAEYFSAKKGHPLASPIPLDIEGSGNVIALTLSANYKVGPLTILPEIRFDKTAEDGAYYDIEGAPANSLVTGTLAAIYKF